MYARYYASLMHQAQRLHEVQDFFLVWFLVFTTHFITHVTHAQCHVISVLSCPSRQLNHGRSLCWRLHWNPYWFVQYCSGRRPDWALRSRLSSLVHHLAPRRTGSRRCCSPTLTGCGWLGRGVQTLRQVTWLSQQGIGSGASWTMAGARRQGSQMAPRADSAHPSWGFSCSYRCIAQWQRWGWAARSHRCCLQWCKECSSVALIWHHICHLHTCQCRDKLDSSRWPDYMFRRWDRSLGYHICVCKTSHWAAIHKQLCSHT